MAGKLTDFVKSTVQTLRGESENPAYPVTAITHVTPTVCRLLGIKEPKQCATAPAREVLQFFGEKKPDRVLLYNPDAVAWWLWEKYPELLAEAAAAADCILPLRSVMPSVTPVCFASMYTGAMPKVHGIQTYTKPVLKTETLFDACLKAGLKPAIVSTEGDSISKIFLKRDMDYYIYPTTQEVMAAAHKLIAEDAYDLITVYDATYDSTMHKYGPEAPESLAVLRQNAERYAALRHSVQKYWIGHTALIGFCPDHGCHEIDGGCGSHGLDQAEDMIVCHMYAAIAA
ncbi:MAG: alkaline phosphatase family protein [Oscillospiraceae bacterium]|jgi:hypothetical protein|nr:alkaline phosphatase family protein [Oscillospiraceae bacterium]